MRSIVHIMTVNKPRVIKNYDRLDPSLQEQIKLNYPYGFDKYLITFKDSKGKFVSALPFETDDRFYLVRMTREQAISIIREDSDYDEYGKLRSAIREKYEEKYDDLLEDVKDIPEEILKIDKEIKGEIFE